MADIYYSETALSFLKADLGYYESELPADVEAYLKGLLNVAFHALARAGIALRVGEVYDDQLQAMYAAWKYRKSREGSEMSPMLRQEIRDRQVAQAVGAEDEVCE